MVILKLIGRLRFDTFPSGYLMELESAYSLVCSELAHSLRSFVIRKIKCKSFRNLGRRSVDFGLGQPIQRLLQAKEEQEHTLAPRAQNSNSSRHMKHEECGSESVSYVLREGYEWWTAVSFHNHERVTDSGQG